MEARLIKVNDKKSKRDRPYLCIMYPSKGEKIISLLRWPSIILVACLLGIFLYKSHTTEKQRIEKEAGLLFVNAIKGIEGNLFNKLILDSLNPNVFFSNQSNLRTLKITNIKKTHEDMWAKNGERDSLHLQDSVKIVLKKDIDFVQARSVTENLGETQGVISIIMRSTDSIRHNASSFTYNFVSDSLLSEKIIKSFDQNLALAGLKVKYVFNKSRDTLAGHKNPTGMYTDLVSGSNYSVTVKNAGMAALKSLWLEMVLSILLLSSLGIAFYTMSRTIAQERALMTTKNDFIQNMTHELKTPIATVKVALEGLYEFDGMDDINKRDEYLKISQNELDRLSLLVDRVLSLSRLDKELPPAVKENIHINGLVSQIADTFKVQALKQNAVIDVHAENPNLYLNADRQWISGIIYNLLENAIKYADKNHTQIDLYLSQNQGDIEIKIKDNGPGIAQEYQSKIFEKFYRIPQGNVHTIKGHGLGLAFVKKLVEEMGGKISLFSVLGKGSEFSITLPV